MSKTLKFGILLLVLICLGLLTLILVDFQLDIRSAGAVTAGEDPPGRVTGEPDLTQAIQSALANQKGHWQLFDYQIERIQVQDDGLKAIAWLAAYELDSGELLGREPELALAVLNSDGTWQVLLNDDPGFEQALREYQYAEKNIHGELLSESDVQPKSARVFGGYYLPWAAGLEKRLTWSVGHTSCSPIYYCTHAFDFADGTMFPLVASKGGTVYHWRDSCANHDSNCMNSITLQDRSTTPWTYQIYLHIAHNSIPDHLKQVGARVLQGQYIADVDNTGPSTGHHVHFMVVTEDTKYISWRGYVFGVAEDITFRDVSINWHEETQGGRPRLAYEASSYGGEGQTYYISGNEPAFPPTGRLTAPATKTYVTDRNLTVSGWGEDDIEVVKMEILAKYGEDWVQIGEEQTDNPFTATVDLCNTDIPNGPFSLALRVWDYEGNPSAILTPRQLIKNVECGTPGAYPNVNLVLNEGVLALPGNGFVHAEATPGSTGSQIDNVEFWFHGRNWSQANWVYLGKDTDGSDGWKAPINNTSRTEADNYTIVAVATDRAGRKRADVNFQAIVDQTPPWVTVDRVQSPVMTDEVTITWTGGDDFSGLDYYSLYVRINNASYQLLEPFVSKTTNAYTFSVSESQLIVIEVKAHDKSGNVSSQKVAMYTDGYEFEHSTIFSLFFNDR